MAAMPTLTEPRQCSRCRNRAVEGKAQCGPCAEKGRAAQAKWREANSEKIRTKNANWYRENPEYFRAQRLVRYGLTVDEYHKLSEAQGNVCAICKRPETVRDPRTDTLRSLAVDHCHSTGRVRALLCSLCNTAIGKMNDDPDRLEAAAAYLRSFNNHNAAPDGE